MLVAGDREVETGNISVRTREGVDLGSMSVDAFAEYLTAAEARLGRTEAN